jgi:hypothetical protein
LLYSPLGSKVLINASKNLKFTAKSQKNKPKIS